MKPGAQVKETSQRIAGGIHDDHSFGALIFKAAGGKKGKGRDRRSSEAPKTTLMVLLVT